MRTFVVVKADCLSKPPGNFHVVLVDDRDFEREGSRPEEYFTRENYANPTVVGTFVVDTDDEEVEDSLPFFFHESSYLG